jgi:hypothetical protein
MILSESGFAGFKEKEDNVLNCDLFDLGDSFDSLHLHGNPKNYKS